MHTGSLIFISYSSHDQSVAETVCSELENRGYDCWISCRDIAPGENFQVAIVRAIRAAKIMILLFSGNSNNSEEIKKEIVLAGQSRLVVIPVRIEDVTPHEAFAYEFATRQWIDLFADWESGITRLARQLAVATAIAPSGTDLSSAKLPSGSKESAGPLPETLAGASQAKPDPAVPLPLPDKPSIAVLPFANMSGDPEQEYFVDGMVEEIITALSRIRWLFVLARNSSFTYKGQAVDVKQVGRELGVRYVLEGSVRKGGNRVRITGQLVDAVTGAHLWADRFDGSLEDVFELQDKVASCVAGVIEPALQAAEAARSANRPTKDLTAYDLYLRAVACFFPVTRERVREALGMLEQAIERDPKFAPALAWAAICQLRLHVDGWAEHPETDVAKGIYFARQALQAAANDPAPIANAVFALSYFGEEIGAMIALIENALALNPSFARGWYLSGMVRLMAGEPDLAIQHAETALRLSPRISVGGHYHVIGRANFFKHNFEEAMSKLLVAVQEQPGSTDAFRFLAATYAHSGRPDQAGEIIRQLRAITPVVMPSVIPYRNPEHRELLLSGLRLAAAECKMTDARFHFTT